MVKQCCACHQHVFKGCGITFHSFPLDIERRRLWIKNIGREKDWTPSKYSAICSKHFTEDSFDKERLGGTWLKPTAVPTIFEPITLRRRKRSKQSSTALSVDKKEEEAGENYQQVLVQPVMEGTSHQNVQLLQVVMKPKVSTDHNVQVHQPRMIPVVPQILFVKNSGTLDTAPSSSAKPNHSKDGDGQNVSEKTGQNLKQVEGSEVKHMVHPQVIIQPGYQTSSNQTRKRKGLKCQPWSNIKFVEQEPSLLQVPLYMRIETTNPAVKSGTVASDHTNTTVSYSLQKSQSRTNVTPEMEVSDTADNQTKKKRLGYIGDFTADCLKHPANLKKYMALVEREMGNKNKHIKVLKQKIRRLEKQVSILTDTCIDLKQKLLFSKNENN